MKKVVDVDHGRVFVTESDCLAVGYLWVTTSAPAAVRPSIVS